MLLWVHSQSHWLLSVVLLLRIKIQSTGCVTTHVHIYSLQVILLLQQLLRAALHILKSEPERRENLWKITNYALDCFRQAGFEIGDTESPIIPLYVRDTDKTFEVTKLAFDEGIFINPVIPPACAPQDTLVRVALMATHTKEQVDYAVDKLTKCFKKLEIIKVKISQVAFTKATCFLLCIIVYLCIRFT